MVVKPNATHRSPSAAGVSDAALLPATVLSSSTTEPSIAGVPLVENCWADRLLWAGVPPVHVTVTVDAPVPVAVPRKTVKPASTGSTWVLETKPSLTQVQLPPDRLVAWNGVVVPVQALAKKMKLLPMAVGLIDKVDDGEPVLVPTGVKVPTVLSRGGSSTITSVETSLAVGVPPTVTALLAVTVPVYCPADVDPTVPLPSAELLNGWTVLELFAAAVKVAVVVLPSFHPHMIALLEKTGVNESVSAPLGVALFPVLPPHSLTPVFTMTSILMPVVPWVPVAVAATVIDPWLPLPGTPGTVAVQTDT